MNISKIAIFCCDFFFLLMQHSPNEKCFLLPCELDLGNYFLRFYF